MIVGLPSIWLLLSRSSSDIDIWWDGDNVTIDLTASTTDCMISRTIDKMLD